MRLLIGVKYLYNKAQHASNSRRNIMLRIRFKTNSEDYRPINWPLKHPYWCSGYGEGYATLISYADDESYIMDNWPEAYDLDPSEETEYLFTSRFPKPKWFTLEEPPPSH